MTLFTDHESYVCEWLENLVQAGELIGEVLRRDIREIAADDITGHERVHFFSGIGGWELALQLAGWQGAVWTGSCPCQPFSIIGQGKGEIDVRHLWPAWRKLIAECRPPTIFGEQVASPAGRAWLAAVRSDLEALGYAVGAADLCAASVGAPHARARIYWAAVRMGYSVRPRLEGYTGHGNHAPRWAQSAGSAATTSASNWADVDWALLRDGTERPVEAGTLPMADGIPTRMGRISAYGNAIVPQLAAEFISAFAEIITI